ncbi:MAG: hypothetical protein NW223_02580 [Hyphomicrobiaceae bacterium]|nr:hypothetical protein [Hyphomicrobiaceae bacterium]
MTDKDGDHWLVRPSTIRLLWTGGLLVLAVLVLLDLVVPHHPHFRLDALFGFAAWYGLGACVGLVLLAKALGVILKRPDTYYDE